jgi:hypothetical protein
MRTVRILVIALTLGVLSAWAQTFDSGSDGSYGPINITVNTTLQVPQDGIFNATTVSVGANATLTFTRNARNTPVHILATGDVTILGDIAVNGGSGNQTSGGLAGPGGFDGGNPASVSTPPGDGYGPGSGRSGTIGDSSAVGAAGAGAYAMPPTINSTNKGAVYGSALLLPLVGGSGGGGTQGNPGYGGGGGGGAILIASNTRISFGNSASSITALGGATSGNPNNNTGSGGAIRLVAPSIVANGASLQVLGGNGYNGSSVSGPGRIRIDALDRSGLNFNFAPSGITSIGSMMVVFPDPTPRLDIVDAAGTPIPEGSGPVLVNLPFGSSPNRTVTVRARDFNAVIPIRIVLTPDHGAALSYDASIDNAAANPAQAVVNITLPVNVQTRINAWSR